MSRRAPDGHDDGYRRKPGDGGRVLWGRVVILGLALVLMFFLGRCTAGADADGEQEVERLEQRVDELEQDNLSLREQLEAARAGGTESGDGEESGGEAGDDASGGDDSDDSDADGSDGTEDGAEDDGDEGSAEGASDDEQASDEGGDGEGVRTHEVQRGESLYRLAERYYGDGDKFRVIARANGLRTDEPIHPGQTLEIPPDPDA